MLRCACRVLVVAMSFAPVARAQRAAVWPPAVPAQAASASVMMPTSVAPAGTSHATVQVAPVAWLPEAPAGAGSAGGGFEALARLTRFRYLSLTPDSRLILTVGRRSAGARIAIRF